MKVVTTPRPDHQSFHGYLDGHPELWGSAATVRELLQELRRMYGGELDLQNLEVEMYDIRIR